MPKTSPTLAEIAAAAGVSSMTASRAMNNQPGVSRSTRDAILKLANDMGYVANRSAQKLSGGRSRVIGLLAAEMDGAFTGALVSAAVRAVAAVGYEALIYSLTDRAQRPNDSVLQLLQQVSDGVIAILPYQFGYVEALSAAQVPVVTIDQHTEHAEFPSIASDSYGGARSAMLHLAELGHQRIAFITGDERMNSARDRHRAFDDAVAILGLDRDPALVLRGDYSLGSGREAAQQLLALPVRPTALFASNDLSAFGAMSVLQSAGLRVPHDISVVGFDDLEAASLVHPGLTTVRQPMAEMGRAAANTLLALIAGLDVATQQVSLPTELVVRASTAACQRSGKKKI